MGNESIITNYTLHIDNLMIAGRTEGRGNGKEQENKRTRKGNYDYR